MIQPFCSTCQTSQPTESKYCRTCGKELDNHSKNNDLTNRLPAQNCLSTALTLPLEQNDSPIVTQPIQQITAGSPQKARWKTSLVILLTCIATSVLVLIITLLHTPSFKDKELAFQQFEYQMDEHVQKPFDKWLQTSPVSPSGCDVGRQFAASAIKLAKQFEAFDTEELRTYRFTKAMEKEEYIAMSYSIAAGATDICKGAIPEDQAQTILYAREALSRYEAVVAMRQDLFTQKKQEQDSSDLRKVAQDIENVTIWYAARAACILYLHGQYDYMKAYKLAQSSYDLFPTEPHEPWMDQVLHTSTISK